MGLLSIHHICIEFTKESLPLLPHPLKPLSGQIVKKRYWPRRRCLPPEVDINVWNANIGNSILHSKLDILRKVHSELDDMDVSHCFWCQTNVAR